MKYTSEFNLCWPALLEIEGIDKSLIAGDPGGISKFGITEQTARRHGFESSTITEPQAKSIAYVEYWQQPNFHLVAHRSVALAFELFEYGYWAGPTKAVKAFQDGVSGMLEQPLVQDGKLGPVTLGVIDDLMRREKGELAMVHTMNGEQYIYMKHRGEVAEYMRKIQRGLRGSRLANPFDSLHRPTRQIEGDAPQQSGQSGAAP